LKERFRQRNEYKKEEYSGESTSIEKRGKIGQKIITKKEK